MPIDPIDGIFEAFSSSDIVALGEGPHRNEQAHKIRVELIRDPRFAGILNDIVVEFGSGRYQSVMDRFIAGEDVAYSDLRHAWEDTTAIGDIWDRPIYEEFFRAVRDVNSELPEHQRYRVLLGGPPVDWQAVLQADAPINITSGWGDQHAAALIRREVLDKNRKALVLYANVHLLRAPRVNIPVSLPPAILEILKAETDAELFSIYTTHIGTAFTLEPDIETWPFPALTTVRGTALGTAQFSYHHSGVSDGPYQAMQEQFDAILYLGGLSDLTFSGRNPARCAEPEYLQMRRQRMEHVGATAQSLMRFCEALEMH